MTDGRDELLDRTLASFDSMVTGPVTRWVMFDDTGDVPHALMLQARYPAFEVVSNGRRNGFGDAVRLAWQHVDRGRPDERFVFHLEDDFVFERPVDLWQLAELLDRRPYLAQMVLRRQAWNAREIAAGGVVECNPTEYVERWELDPRAEWLEHRLFFSTNPSLFRRELLSAGWMGGDQAEGRFTHLLLAEGIPGAAWPDVRFGYWGARDSGVWVRHVGTDRVGHGY